jgi:ACS family sodium-dependent inorganic phosphate cotransporter
MLSKRFPFLAHLKCLFILVQDGPFAWPEPTQGLVLGAYFWGYILTQIPGGRVAEMFSAKWVIWGSVLINVVFTILTPVAANISYIAVLVVRFVEGLGAVRNLFY